MANNLSFSVRLELLAEKFKQQAEGAKSALRGIQFQALAMAGALGTGITSLRGLVSALVDTAREAGRARIILRNVSADAREYGNSIKYITELTEKYGTDLIGTTTAFAKFKAAATPAGIAVAEQEKIFANVSKAMASFGISGGEAALTMMAITQMMSKGKISSEELRRQLGERMPVAMQAMANAAGVSLSQLDKLLKDGKLRSAEVMGKFSDELAKLSGDTSTDNLEASIGRLKNAFVSLADSLNIYGNFKALVDRVKDLIDYLKTHLSNFYIWAGGLLAVRLWGKFSSMWSQADAMIRSSQAQEIADSAAAKATAEKTKKQAEKALHDAQEKLSRAEAAVEKGRVASSSEEGRLLRAGSRGDARFVSAVSNLDKAQAEYRKLAQLHTVYLRGLEAQEMEVANRVASAKQALDSAMSAENSRAIAEAGKAYDRVLAEESRLKVKNDTLREQAEIRYSAKALELQKRVDAAGRALNKAQHDRKEFLAEARAKNEEARIRRLSALQASADKARMDLASRVTNLPDSSASLRGILNTQRAVANSGRLSFGNLVSSSADAESTISMWSRVTTTFKTMWVSAIATVRGLMSSLFPVAIIGTITAIVTALSDWWKKQKEINSLHDDYISKQKEIRTTKGDEEAQISRLFRLYTSLDGKLEEQKTIQHQLEKSLGLQEGSLDRIAGKYDQIKGIVDKIIKLKQIDREIDFYSESSKESRKPIQELYAKYLKDGGRSLSADQLDKATKALAKLGEIGHDGGSIFATVHLARAYKDIAGTAAPSNVVGFFESIRKSGFTYSDLDNAEQNARVHIDSDKKIEELYVKRLKVDEEANASVRSVGGSFIGRSSQGAGSGDSDKSGKKSELQRVRESLEKELKELGNQRSARVISEEEYSIALDKVANQYKEKLASLLGEKVAYDRQYQSLQNLILADKELIEEKSKSASELKLVSAQVRYGLASEDDLRRAKAERAKAELNAVIKMRGELDQEDEYIKAKLGEIDDVSEIAEIQRRYIAESDKLRKAREAGRITEEEYTQSLTRLISSTRERASESASLSPGQDLLKGSLIKRLDSDSSSIIPSRQYRDTTFDYKHDDAHRMSEEKKALDAYVVSLREAEKAGADVSEVLKKMQREAVDLDQAIKIASIQADLKKYQEAVKDKTYSGIKSVAQSARHLKSAFKSLEEVFDPDSQASAWERFFAVFNSATQGLDAILSLIKMIEGLTQARQVAAAAEQALMIQQATGRTMVTATEATATATEIGLTSARIAATQAETSADTIGAAAKAAKAHAGFPIVGVALATAAVGGLIALISSSAGKIPKFANGGIVPGGDGSGDRVMARVNPGELILNKAQQGRLANHLTSAGSLKVEVEGRIKARDILQLNTVATRHKSR
ncbi:tape measure protein [uncultured Porphyromonas sp.]|uniref:tape measure protein n=1 Tax=uncultured Porphyromonas sp. TaxID=159274 RepID=UPI002623C9C0|nr:tape measure protein [uncultured Porphyromonas sp.]